MRRDMKIASQIESKQRSLTLFLLFLVAFSALAFGFSSGVLRAEETPVPPATPATQGAVGISPTATPTIPPSVHAVGVHNWKRLEQRNVYPKTPAQPGDTIWSHFK